MQGDLSGGKEEEENTTEIYRQSTVYLSVIVWLYYIPGVCQIGLSLYPWLPFISSFFAVSR